MRSLLPSRRSLTDTSNAAVAATSESTSTETSEVDADRAIRLVSALARLEQLNGNWRIAMLLGDEEAMARIEEAIEGVLAAMTQLTPLPTQSSNVLF